MKYCFTLICQGGRLEIPSILLVTSLIHFLKCDYEIVVCVPDYPEVQFPRKETLTYLTSLGVSIQYIQNQIDPTYPIANKFSSLLISTDADKLVFLDSDILCMRPFFGLDSAYNKPFSAKLTDLADFNDDEWLQIYSLQSVAPPAFKYQSTVTQQRIPLSFNSGVIFVDNGIGFGEDWLEVAKQIDNIEGIPKKRPFLDQISLPFALKKMNLEFDLLPETYNFPSEIRPLDPLDVPIFCHYHDLLQVYTEKHMMDLIQSLCATNRDLQKLFSLDEEGLILLTAS